jgi:hypothetical protein
VRIAVTVRRHRDERGSITPFVLIISIGILVLAGLVIDGGRQMNGHGRAVSYAQEAARAGTNGIDVTEPRVDLLNSRAMQAANAYCRKAMAEDAELVACSARITELTTDAGTFKAVEVTARVRMDAILLGMIGKHRLNASGSALANPVPGISEADQGREATGGPVLDQPTGGLTPSQAPTDEPPESVPCATVTETVTPSKPKNTKKTKQPEPTVTESESCAVDTSGGS